jgi:hypothetical protein
MIFFYLPDRTSAVYQSLRKLVVHWAFCTEFAYYRTSVVATGDTVTRDHTGEQVFTSLNVLAGALPTPI